jgi:hypothetical protein
VAFIVVYDANVLVPVRLRDLLLRIAEAGIVRARFSDEILDEWERALTSIYPTIDGDKLRLQRKQFIAAVPDCLVTSYAGLADDLELVDASDRHVVAAAIRAQAQLIVTSNLKHFPEHELARFDIEVKHPDEFVLDAIDLFPGRVANIVRQIASELTRPPQTVEQVLTTLQTNSGLVQSVARLREML